MKNRIGLVMEGGAMRGLFTAGVLDAFMNHGIEVDGAIGVSAGAVFGCNFKSRQIGRVLRYNTKYCKDKRYCSFRSLLFTGDLYGAKFCYDTLPKKLDLFDEETYNANPMEFYVVVTECESGKAVYKNMTTLPPDNMDWFRASASMPLVSRPVKIGDKHYLDGGISDSIPLKAMESLGFSKNIVIETRPITYCKNKSSIMDLAMTLVPFKNIAKAMKERPKVYMSQIEYVKKAEEEGRAFVIRPSKALPLSQIEKDPAKLRNAYEMGYQEGMKNLDAIREFIG